MRLQRLNALKEEGKIRSIGVSNFGVEQLSEALATGVQIDVNQLCYNLLSRGIELEILPLCQRKRDGYSGIYAAAARAPDRHV